MTLSSADSFDAAPVSPGPSAPSDAPGAGAVSPPPAATARTDERIRVRVRPSFSLARSELSSDTFVFTYRVHVDNDGPEPAQLLYRHWKIHDSVGEDTEIDGEGVIGKQPVIGSGERHAYSSFCVLRSPLGYMEGHYIFARADGRQFRVDVPRFTLSAPILMSVEGDEDSVVMH